MLKRLIDEEFILAALVLVQTLQLGAQVSVKSQKDNYSIWDDADVIARFRADLRCLEKSPQSNSLIEKHKDDILAGKFQGIDFVDIRARVLSHGRSTRGVIDDEAGDLADKIRWAYEQQSDIASALLSASAQLLTVPPEVKMLHSIFMCSEYPREPDALDAFAITSSSLLYNFTARKALFRSQGARRHHIVRIQVIVIAP